RATALAAAIGRGFGYAMVGLGVFAAAAGALGGLWLAVVGVFVVVAAKAEEGGLRVRTAFAGREAGRFDSFPAVTVPATISVAEAVERFFVPYRYTAFPVIDEGEPVGLLDAAHVERLPANRRAGTGVAEIAITDPELIVGEHQDVAELLERPAFQRVGRAVVRNARGEVGVISITDVNRALRAIELSSSPAGR
ncbi:MAG TPA: CBS domain-containing protein, partial [Solirubrobacterales bacterium]